MYKVVLVSGICIGGTLTMMDMVILMIMIQAITVFVFRVQHHDNSQSSRKKEN